MKQRLQANELRIGNLVYNTKGEIDTITLEALKYIGEEPHHQVKPIILTEDMLLRLGFEKLPHKNITNALIKSLGRNRFITIGSIGSPNLMAWIVEKEVMSDEYSDLICIHNYDYDGELYAHTLQNIWHSIAKTELTLKP